MFVSLGTWCTVLVMGVVVYVILRLGQFVVVVVDPVYVLAERLLSEIAEVEEQKDDLTSSLPHKHHHLKQQQQQQQRGREERLKGQTQLTRGHKRRSLSLPTGSLAFGDARIVYKNGHFTFETMETDENDLEQTGQTGSQGSSSNVNRPETSQEEYQRGTKYQKLSSSSLPEVKDEDVRRVMQRAKRTSSFRQAQEVGALRLSGIEEDKKNKSESSLGTASPVKTDYPATPPIAVFQDDDIDSAETPPSSPFVNREFRRRHTSADIYRSKPHPDSTETDSNCPTPTQERSVLKLSISTPSTPVHDYSSNLLNGLTPSSTRSFRDEDSMSVTSVSSATSSVQSPPTEQPNKPKTPKPSGDGSAKSLGKQRKQSFSKDRSDSGRSRKDSATRGNYDRLGIMLQTEVASSNSNDSGIQRDASLHSSSDSLKAVGEGKIQSHRDPSSSPLPDRAQRSEVGVRWADVEDSGDTTPIVMRAHRFRDRPRPQSDIEDNIQLFDELFAEVLQEFESAGSSFLSERVRAFGSEVNLQPYSSLRNLYEMRRRDLDKQKNRRMSTPHPIKSRLQRAPRRLQKQLPLVRSSSMPESLDKLHKRRKLHHLLDFHIDSHLDGSGSLSSDSDLSFDQASLQEKSLSDEEGLTYAEALWDHITMDPEELAFRAQDVIEVHDMADKDWWFGAIEDREGWFPAAFVRLRVNQEEVEEEEMEVTMVHETLLASPKLRRVSMLNKNQARTNGYIVHARKRTEMFGNERIELIFGNIETIYGFAQKFLQKLEMCFDVCPHLSEIGQCFLDNHRGFEIYSDYCNNHPSASEELKDLCRDSKYKHFFEACRLLQDLVEIPLEGFLLTPVQKICKYPLQLAELLKYTPPDHADYKKVSEALSAMRKIATLINERKRKMESIEKIAAWQQSVVDWEGPDLLECSSELIFSGELTKVNTAGWAQERSFFLFDHQLIYCKKDLLKRHVFSYKGRIDLDHCDITSVEDGKDPQYSTVVKNAWKFHETEKDKWYLVSAKSPAGKERWLKAIQDQKQRVQEDQENDFCVPDHWKQTVLNKVRSQSHIKDKHSRRPLHSQSSLHKDFKESGFSTLPRQRHHSTDKHDKKSFWSKFGGKKTKR
ncbi:SPT13-like protein [Mya arenaria]|uniref:SPT13-like protein n=1 Tax=Mya arenaria TaxID=6604 RepID=A0ABY7G3N9_MYAAR|nr:SPT13-like protein [Mya arenaria]